LAIVKELVAAHSGVVGAESDSEGLTVWFELPLRTHEGSTLPDPAQSTRSLDAATTA
jgi:signal transduction histidine kinase